MKVSTVLRTGRFFYFVFLVNGLTYFSFAQQPQYSFGKVSLSEKNMAFYSKDSSAIAVVLHEEANLTFVERNDRMVTETKYFRRIKIFKKEAYKYGTIEIPIYKTNKTKEKVEKIRAITHNAGEAPIYIDQKKIFIKEASENYELITFGIPRIKEGSVIEYEYTLSSPFWHVLPEWEFQWEIPKVYSRFYTSIPGNFIYKGRINDYLSIEEIPDKLKRRCLSISGYRESADCIDKERLMKNIPAFKKEDYLNSEENYKSKIKYELETLHRFDGTRERFIKSWRDADKQIKQDEDIGSQLRKNAYFKNKVPESILKIRNPIEKAEAIFEFVQNHLAWNGNYGIFRDARVKQAWENGSGNVAEINLSLINALKVAGLDAHLVLSSTRNNGIPTELYPVITDFNYVLAALIIGDKTILLDATEKYIPFAMLPKRALNYRARVFDFKSGSYWMDIKPGQRSGRVVFSDFALDSEGHLNGDIHINTTGYLAVEQREKIKDIGEENYINTLEDDHNIEIDSYEFENASNNQKSLKIRFKMDGEIESMQNSSLIYPFIFGQFKSNPFKMKKRLYPVDFAYPFSLSYIVNITLDDSYTINELPDNMMWALPNKGGKLLLATQKDGKTVKLNFRFNLKRYLYEPQEYETLKFLFGKMVDLINNTPIVVQQNSMPMQNGKNE